MSLHSMLSIVAVALSAAALVVSVVVQRRQFRWLAEEQEPHLAIDLNTLNLGETPSASSIRLLWLSGNLVAHSVAVYVRASHRYWYSAIGDVGRDGCPFRTEVDSITGIPGMPDSLGLPLPMRPFLRPEPKTPYSDAAVAVVWECGGFRFWWGTAFVSDASKEDSWRLQGETFRGRQRIPGVRFVSPVEEARLRLRRPWQR